MDREYGPVLANTTTYLGDCCLMMKNDPQFKDGKIALKAYNESYQLKSLIYGVDHRKTMGCATNYG